MHLYEQLFAGLHKHIQLVFLKIVAIFMSLPVCWGNGISQLLDLQLSSVNSNIRVSVTIAIKKNYKKRLH
jgi:hypothetical protein